MDFMLALPSFVSVVPWLTAFFLLSLRTGAVLLLTPILSSSGMPVSIRFLLTLGLSAALIQGLPLAGGGIASSLSFVNSPGALLQAGVVELALGATLATGVHLAFAVFSVAGRLLDVLVGFGMGQVFNPVSNTNEPLITSAFNQIAVVVFFLVDGHHALLRGIAYSLERFPLGVPWPMNAAVMPLIKQASGLLGLAFSLAAPVVFCILVVEFSLGVLARNLPQMNMLVMGAPIKIVVGLLVLLLWLGGGIGSSMSRVYASIYQSWDTLLAAKSVPSSSLPGGR